MENTVQNMRRLTNFSPVKTCPYEKERKEIENGDEEIDVENESNWKIHVCASTALFVVHF